MPSDTSSENPATIQPRTKWPKRIVSGNGGADRSGLASALYCLAVEGEPAEKADRQLTIWYGHIPLIRPKVTAMDDSFWRYVTNHIPPVKSAENVSADANR